MFTNWDGIEEGFGACGVLYCDECGLPGFHYNYGASRWERDAA